jgi:tRNA (guanine37-N1)-methyltransferase
MKFNIITIFPDIINSYFSETILARAIKKKIIKINAINLRDFTTDKHQKVDDTPYGGGAGMVMKPEPIYKALKSIKSLKSVKSIKSKVTILLSARGKQFDQRMAEKLSKMKEITFVCGRYEGVDQRVSDYMVDEEISIGPYVLAGGELGALVMIESIARLLKGVLGNEESLREETFNEVQSQEFRAKSSEPRVQDCEVKLRTPNSELRTEYPQYTKPAEFRKWKVPEVLLSGNHKKIKEWREGGLI